MIYQIHELLAAKLVFTFVQLNNSFARYCTLKSPPLVSLKAGTLSRLQTKWSSRYWLNHKYICKDLIDADPDGDMSLVSWWQRTVSSRVTSILTRMLPELKYEVSTASSYGICTLVVCFNGGMEFASMPQMYWGCLGQLHWPMFLWCDQIYW